MVLSLLVLIDLCYQAGRKWASLDIEAFLKNIDEWRVSKNLVFSNKIYNLDNVSGLTLFTIVNIKFPFLMNLELSHNMIETIEPIDRIWMPSIERINLGTFIFKEAGNKISSVKVMRRLKKSQLKKINLGTCI